jgi:hypothetical protein
MGKTIIRNYNTGEDTLINKNYKEIIKECFDINNIEVFTENECIVIIY